MHTRGHAPTHTHSIHSLTHAHTHVIVVVTGELCIRLLYILSTYVYMYIYKSEYLNSDTMIFCASMPSIVDLYFLIYILADLHIAILSNSYMAVGCSSVKDSFKM